MGCYDFGRWDAALDYLARMPAELPAALRIGHHGLAALMHAHREEWTPAERHLAEGLRIPIGSGDVRIWSGYLIAADAMRAVTDGDLRQAAALLSTWLDPDAEFENRERYMWLPPLLRVARELGDRDLERAVAAATEQDAQAPEALAMQRAAARLCRAQIEDDSETLQQVATVYEEHGWPLMRAFAIEEAAVRLAAAGQIDAGPGRVQRGGARLRRDGRDLGRTAGGRAPAPAGHPARQPDPGPAAGVGVGGADRRRAPGRRTGRDGPVQPGRGQRAVPVAADGADPRVADPAQARLYLADGPRTGRGPAVSRRAPDRHDAQLCSILRSTYCRMPPCR